MRIFLGILNKNIFDGVLEIAFLCGFGDIVVGRSNHFLGGFVRNGAEIFRDNVDKFFVDVADKNFVVSLTTLFLRVFTISLSGFVDCGNKISAFRKSVLRLAYSFW